MVDKPESTSQFMLMLGIIAGTLAGVLQLSSVLIQERVPIRRILIGSVVISTLVGVGVALLLYTHAHAPLVLSGILGAASGFVPGARWVTLAQRALEQQLEERLKLKLGQAPAAPDTEVPA